MKKIVLGVLLAAIVITIVAVTLVKAQETQKQQTNQNMMGGMMGQDSNTRGMHAMMNMMHRNTKDHEQMHKAMEKAIENSGNKQLKEMHESCEEMMGEE